MTWNSGPSLDPAPASCLAHQRLVWQRVTDGAWLHPDGWACDQGRPVPVPPPRSLHVRPATAAELHGTAGPGLLVTCDCGESCLLTFAPAMAAAEVPYTCGRCLSVHWLTLAPATRGETA